MRGLIVLPTYNEAENIKKALDNLMNYENIDILVIDDNSQDGTAEIVKTYPEFNNKVFFDTTSI